MYRTSLSAGLLVAVIGFAPVISAEPDLAQGKALYERHCTACHGEGGDGKGEAERYLSPKARDFTAGVFKFRSTPSGSPPTDEDLYRTARRGVSGTSMPSFDRLSDQELTSVIAYVKSFSDIFEDEDAKEPPVQIGNAPESSSQSVAVGAATYKEMECYKCHGEGGKGDGPSADKLTDDWDQPIRPYDLTRGPMLMKGGATSQAIYRTFMTGLDGTPMPSYMDDMPAEDRWPLVHYIQSLSGSTGLELSDSPAGTSTLGVTRIKKNISLDINDSVWDGIPAAEVALRPIRARDVWPDSVQTKVVINSTQIAFRFEWKDAEPNEKVFVTTDFVDGIALQFVPRGMPQDFVGIPFFGMGDEKEKVHIWNWKATAKKLDSGNGKQNRPVSVLEAYGFGTLEDQPDAAQTVDAAGTWQDGKWIVVLRQDLKDSSFSAYESIPVAVAAWDGSERDRAGQKSVSEWMELKLK